MNKTTISTILYADDDKDDHLFLCESLAATGIVADLIHALDGEEAINYLNSVTNLEELPSLIILDLNMPKWDGRETLNYIRSHPRFSSIPVVILSTSESRIDKEICTRLGASSYFQKPFNYNGYSSIIENFIPLMRGSS